MTAPEGTDLDRRGVDDREGTSVPHKATVKAVDRALSVMAALEKAQGPQTLTDLSLATGLYKSAVLRLIESLKAAGYIARFSNGKYSLGPTIFRLGAAYERLNPIREYIGVVLNNLVS